MNVTFIYSQKWISVFVTFSVFKSKIKISTHMYSCMYACAYAHLHACIYPCEYLRIIKFKKEVGSITCIKSKVTSLLYTSG